jgi:DNA-binding NarL/FixJ family response regulator
VRVGPELGGGFSVRRAMRLIIVEDEPLLAICISDTVEAAGHQVICCVASADRALACAREKGADLALVNISLDEGATAGVALARLKRPRHSIDLCKWPAYRFYSRQTVRDGILAQALLA